MKKTRAFTLIELVIVLILSCLVVASAASIYIFSNRSFLIYKSANEWIMDSSRLNSVLQNDFFKSMKIEKSEGSVLFTSYGNQIIYTFNDFKIIRTQNDISDTFDFNQPQIHYLMNSEEVSAGGLMDELYIKGYLNNLMVTYHFKKEYDAVRLLNRK